MSDGKKQNLESCPCDMFSFRSDGMRQIGLSIFARPVVPLPLTPDRERFPKSRTVPHEMTVGDIVATVGGKTLSSWFSSKILRFTLFERVIVLVVAVMIMSLSVYV